MKKFFVLLSFISIMLHAQTPNPNIVIIYADDLGYGDLQCYNKKSKIPTPHLDKMAAEGMLFTDGHSSSGICTPSRYALLTGRHHWRDFHGIVGAFGGSVFKKGRLTMAQMLKESGYKTAVIGKWHLGWDWDAIKKKDAKQKTIEPGKKKRKRYGPEEFDWNKQIPGGPLDVRLLFRRYSYQLPSLLLD